MAQSALATKPVTILVKNVYHLMSYAFNAVDVREYRTLEAEDFSGMDDLLAAILLLGIESQRRRGLERDYQPVRERGWRIKGRIDMGGTMRLQMSGRAEVAYVYDEYTEDTLCNRILKTSALILSGSGEVSSSRRRRLHGALAYLQGVSPIADPARIPWNTLRYHRNNRSYQMLMGVCHLVIQHQLMGEREGERHLAVFDDRQAFSALFERFLLNYYRRHFPELDPKGQSEMKPGPDAPSFLPAMYEDVVLTHGDRTLIIDAKCYGRILSMRFDQPRLSAEHVRQIFYYAIHTGSPENTSALLVYAGTEESHVAETWRDQGYEMGCITLDLNREFTEIRGQLDTIPKRFTRNGPAIPPSRIRTTTSPANL